MTAEDAPKLLLLPAPTQGSQHIAQLSITIDDIDISPPLKLTERLHSKYSANLTHLCIVDVEGLKCSVMPELMKTVASTSCIVMLSCTDGINDEDVDLCLRVVDGDQTRGCTDGTYAL